MKRVGEVVRIAQHLAIVRAPDDDHVDIGTPVVDENLDHLGRVVDVFGPVDRPYLAVTADDDVHLPALVGTPLYAR
ncbi:H/ACA ribonucleoprotein complex subunit GAR1 [Halosimplex aquaticum]|uniref:H/ACA ribonucleoprotein complex subunit GAR1 n=1 Tax=Halosimplex aquaticum TaxID=3026162 RepID=A0ABD5Y2U1_9EURY|nr:Gar1/Naf1 family protein [Halosimplex aquaticum]